MKEQERAGKSRKEHNKARRNVCSILVQTILLPATSLILGVDIISSKVPCSLTIWFVITHALLTFGPTLPNRT
jgi:hypothetical protein